MRHFLMSEVTLYMFPVPFQRRAYRGTSLTGKRSPLGPYRRPMPWVLGGPKEGGCFLMIEVPLRGSRDNPKDLNDLM